MIYKVSMALLLFSAGAIRCAAAPPSGVPSLRKVALSGEVAPGAGRTFSQGFGSPIINNLGQTAFVGNLNCCSIPAGVWSTGTGSLKNVGLIGSPAQPGGSQNYLTFYGIQFDDLGRTTVTAEVTNTPAEFQGIFTATDSTNVNRIAASRQPIAGSNPSATFFDVGGVAVGSNGYMAAAVLPQGRSITYLLWVSDGNGPGHKLFQNGDPVPFAGPNVFFGSQMHNTFYVPDVNDRGQLGLRASFVNSLTNDFNTDYHLVFVDTDNHLESVLDSGDAAPGFGPGKFGAISDPAINNLGDFAYGAVISPFGVGSRAGVWLSKHGEGPQLIALENTQPSAAPSFTITKTYFSDTGDNFVRLSDKQDVVFRAEVDGPGGLHDAETIWIGSSSSNVHPLLVEGNSVPDRPGLVFRSMSSTSGDLASQLTMNKNSQVAFLASVSGIGSDLRYGLFATDISGALHSIVMYGDMIEVSPGIFRQVDSINFDGGRSIPGSGFNDLGELAFTIRFTDATGGVFVSSAVAIPEPRTTSVFALAITIAAIFTPRWRKTICTDWA